MQDQYTWRANYNDSTSLRQIDPDGTKHAYADIDRTKLVSFELLEGENVVLSVPFDPGEKLIWRRRVEMNSAGVVATVHIIGKQATVDGQNRQVVFGLHPDGHVDVSDKWDDAHPWYFPVQIHTHEGEE